MKDILLSFKGLIFITIICCQNLYSQMPSIEWSTYYGGELTSGNIVTYSPEDNAIYFIGHTADTTNIGTTGTHMSNIAYGTYYGTSPSFPLPMNRWPTYVFIAKFDMEGNRLWGSYWGGSAADYFLSAAKVDNEGNLIITGKSKNLTGLATSGAYQMYSYNDSITYFMVKFSNLGHVQWSTYLDIATDSIINYESHYKSLAIDIDENNNIYVLSTTNKDGLASIGAYQEFRSGYSDLLLMKFNSYGSKLWSTYIGIENNENMIDFSLIDSQSFNLLFSSTNGMGISTHIMGRYTKDEGFIWQKELPGNIKPLNISTDLNEQIYIMGYVGNDIGGTIDWNFISDDAFKDETELSSTSSDVDALLLKYDKNGIHKWGTLYGGEGLENNPSILLGLYEMLITDRLKISSNGQYIYFGISTLSSTLPNNTCGVAHTYTGGALAKFDSSGNFQWGGFFDAPIAGIDIISEDRFGNPTTNNTILIASKTDNNGLATPGSFKDNKDGLMFASMLTKISESCPLATPSISYSSPQLTVDGDYESYTWYHNGTAVSTGDSESYTPGADTTGYYYAMVSKCGCDYFTDTFYFDDIGIRQLDFERHFRLYPNPTTDLVRLEVLDASTNISAADIQVHNLLGQLQTVLISQPTATNFSINMQQLPAGAYLLQVRNTKGLWTKQVVKW